jgi:hypothetical protein
MSTLALGGLLLGLAQCATTSAITSWHDPSFVSGSLHRPLVVALAKRPTVRVKLEDALVSALRNVGVDAAASYRVFPEAELSAGAIADKLPTTDRDSLLITHLVDVKTETYELATPSEAYPGFADRWGTYYTQRYNVIGSPEYNNYETYDVRKYVLRTNLYDAKSDKLVWTVLTQSEAPTRLDTAVRGFADVVVKTAERDRVF